MIGQPFEIVRKIVVPSASKGVLKTGKDGDRVFKMRAKPAAFLRMRNDAPSPRKLPAFFPQIGFGVVGLHCQRLGLC
jgi:hypothetical protein